MSRKARILLIGTGGIGSMTAFNLERGGLASVTAVLRSNYDAVKQKGFKIESMDHGKHDGWRPTELLNHIPNVEKEGLQPFEYIILTTKNVPDIPPKLPSLIAPAVTTGHSVIVLIQNGLNIEKPFLEAFPENIVLSGVSRMGADEPELGYIIQNDPDRLSIAPFRNPNLNDPEREKKAAEDFVRLYSASGIGQCTYDPDVNYERWRKLLYNSVWNPISALVDLDTSRLRLASSQDPDNDPFSVLNALVRPAMAEIIAAAKAVANVELPEGLIEQVTESDPMEEFIRPSMQQDARKGRFTEFENLVGEALREGEGKGVKMPTIRVLYALCKAKQWSTKEEKGLIDVQESLAERKERTK